MNIATRTTNGKSTIIVELTTEESDRICATIVCNGKGAELHALAMVTAIAALPLEDVNSQIAEIEQTADVKNSGQLLVLKLLQCRRILKEQQKDSE